MQQVHPCCSPNAAPPSPHLPPPPFPFPTSHQHGGLYDHVPSPTTGVPPPQPGSHCIYGGDPYFDFTRLGVRVPTFLISPWTKKQEILNTPTGAAAPHNTSQFTHSSLSRTVHDLFGLAGSLTDRDAWAGSYAPALTALDAPRNDTPASIPPPPAPADGKTAAEGNQPLNDLQVSESGRSPIRPPPNTPPLPIPHSPAFAALLHNPDFAD